MNKVFFLILITLLVHCSASRQVQVTGDLTKWHPVVLTFNGPMLNETGTPNPFLDFRMEVTFSNGGITKTVPGYYCADGHAAESGADSGSKWRAIFVPSEIGTWTYTASFRSGEKAAVQSDPMAGIPTAFNGFKGSFIVNPPDPNSPSPLDKGMLEYNGSRYLRYLESGEYFLKGGADSPENFLAYYEFDGTPKPTHKYLPHAQDWRTGDPVWQNTKGKNIIGALNYLASKNVNSVYFITMNVQGDGKDVWPWTDENERFRFDCSKLDQWEIVFNHMDSKGMMMHVITQEIENDSLLDNGDLGIERTLYYRELIARFAHHPALVWNMGEENDNTDAQRADYAAFFEKNDPYKHPVVVHTWPGRYDQVYTPLLGNPAFDGPSLQMGNADMTHDETCKWVKRSAEAGRQWFVCLDEIGPASDGVIPDSVDYWHDNPRINALWGNLMAGGAGCEWYFGYSYPHHDLNCEDFRSRDHLWDLTFYAIDFFAKHLPFWDMVPADELVADNQGWCLARQGSVYAVYLPNGGLARILLDAGSYTLQWFDPRHGGSLIDGGMLAADKAGFTDITLPPNEPDKDWVLLVQNVKENIEM